MYGSIPSLRGQIRTWVLELRGGYNAVAARTLRLYVLRLNAEHECLKLILRNIANDNINSSSNSSPSSLLQLYLKNAIKRIKRWESRADALFESEIGNIARDSEDLINPGQRNALLSRLEIIGIKKNVFREVEKYTDQWVTSHTTNITLNGGLLKMGDDFNISGGQQGAVGRNAHAHDMTFNQIWNQNGGSIDLPTLAKDLAILRAELLKEAKEPEHYTAIGAVASAETAAQKGDGPKALEYLKAAGTWTFDVATKVGVSVAAEALKTVIGT
jgi:hypothetical protein